MATHSSILAWRILWPEEPDVSFLAWRILWPEEPDGLLSRGCKELDRTGHLTLLLSLPLD